MRESATTQSRHYSLSPLQRGMLPCALLALLACSTSIAGQSQSPSQPATKDSKPQSQAHKARAHKKQAQAPVPVAQTPPPPPMPAWPINDKPSPASVVWDATGLRINASNSSLQQILNEVSTETGTKVEGMGADQRVYGSYGPGEARDVLSQLLQGSGYNVLLAGDLGKGAPREMVLSPRKSGGPASAPAADNNPQPDPDEEIPDQPQPEEAPQPPPPVQAPQTESGPRPGFGPNGPIRTPQQVMEEMQQRQILMQQQQQQQQQQQNPQD